VQGLDHFQVGVRDLILFPTLVVATTGDYTPCLVGGVAAQTPIVAAGTEVEVACDAGIMGQWLIIQSLDTGAEKLCIGEVVVEVFGEYVSMFVLVRQVTLYKMNCSWLFFAE